MTVKEYENIIQYSKIYPQGLSVIYPVIGLNGEAGEVAEKVKKALRDNGGVFGGETRKAILKELADVVWYVWATADDLGYSLKDVLKTGADKFIERKNTNTLHGEGDDREKIQTI